MERVPLSKSRKVVLPLPPILDLDNLSRSGQVIVQIAAQNGLAVVVNHSGENADFTHLQAYSCNFALLDNLSDKRQCDSEGVRGTGFEPVTFRV